MKNYLISFSKNGLEFKTNTIKLPTKISYLTQVFGNQFRKIETELDNIFYFWDDLGIYAIQDTDSGEFHEISIALKQDKHQEEFYPLNMYNGKIQIENFILDGKTSLMQLETTENFFAESPLGLEKMLGKHILDIELGDEDEILSVGFST